jgi:hypothetical protein
VGKWAGRERGRRRAGTFAESDALSARKSSGPRGKAQEREEMKLQNNKSEQELHHDAPNMDKRREADEALLKLEGGLTREELRVLVVEMIG